MIQSSTRFRLRQPLTRWSLTRWCTLPLLAGAGFVLMRQAPGGAQSNPLPATPAAQASSKPVTIAVDKRVQYQQIEGFGAFGGKDVFWAEAPVYDDAFVRLMIKDLGLTILRDEVPDTLEMTNDNDDPFKTDLSKYNLTQMSPDRAKGGHMPLGPHLDYIRAMQKEAAAQGEPFKFIASIWSPPYWMKYTKSVFGEDTTWNRLIVKERASAEVPNDRKDEFAEYCVAYIKLVKQHTGVDVYALSLQNELVFGQPYASAVYSPQEWRNIVRHVGQRFDREKIATKIFGPEDVPDYSRVSQYINVLSADPEARRHLDIMAIHGYGPDGKAVGDTNDEDWKRYYALAAQWNKPLWMTETSGYANTWDGGFSLGQSILSALKYGRLNAWVFWQLSEKGANLSLLDFGVPTPRYWASKPFYRYIRPGAVQVDTQSSDANVQVVGFTHAKQKSTTLVLINSATTAKNVSLKMAGGNLPTTFTQYRSSANEKSILVSNALAPNRVLNLPAKSITTLVGKSAREDAPLAPSFRVAPRNLTVSEGQPVVFGFDAVGTPGLSYQWQRNGANIAGAVGNALTLASARASDNGATFRVTVKNVAGTATSVPVTLTVTPFTGLNIVRTAQAPVIDGRGDAAWGKAVTTELQKVVIGSNLPGPSLAPRVRAMWDDTNLYVMYGVKDDTVWTPKEGESDSVELIIDADNSKSLAYDDNDFQFIFKPEAAPVETKHNAVQGVTSASVRAADGYTIEARIPWKTLGITPQTGKLIGLDLNVNDTDGKERTGKIAWFSPSNDIWFNPALAGTGKLSTQ
jgi:O-glycosyl hydrolase